MTAEGLCLLDNFRKSSFLPAFIQKVYPSPATRMGNPNRKASDSMPAAQGSIIITYEYWWLRAALGLDRSSVNLVP